MKISSFSTFVSAAILLLSCEGEQKHIKDYYSSGKLKSVWTFDEDTTRGVKVLYWENGNVAARFNYDHGMKNGPFILFFRNGNPARSGNSLNNHAHGLVYDYFASDSAIIRKETYQLFYNGEYYDYYSKTYNKLGQLIDEERYLELRAIHDSIIIQNLEPLSFDSVKVVIGKFNSEFVLKGQTRIDTLDFEGDELQISRGTIEQLSVDGYLRGIFLGMRNDVKNDTIFSMIDVRFFEERVDGL